MAKLLSNGWALQELAYNQASPMENHNSLEIAVDDENKVFYVYEFHLNTYGLASVVKSCETYIKGVEQ